VCKYNIILVSIVTKICILTQFLYQKSNINDKELMINEKERISCGDLNISFRWCHCIALFSQCVDKTYTCPESLKNIDEKSPTFFCPSAWISMVVFVCHLNEAMAGILHANTYFFDFFEPSFLLLQNLAHDICYWLEVKEANRSSKLKELSYRWNRKCEWNHVRRLIEAPS
jgi:hypothetical protein